VSWAADGRDRTDDRRIQFSETKCSRFRYVLVHVGTGRVVMEGPCHYAATASSLASRRVRSLLRRRPASVRPLFVHIT